MTKKSRQKCKISLDQKELLRWNKKHFPLFLKGFQLPKINSDLRHFAKLIYLCWLNIYRPTKFSCWQSTRKEITDQSHFFLFLVKFLRKSYLIPFLNTFKRIVFFVITNQVFDLLIHVNINYFLLFMIFMHLLIVTHPKMWEEYFLIYLKPLIEYGVKGSSTKGMCWHNRYASKIVAKLSSKQAAASIA